MFYFSPANFPPILVRSTVNKTIEIELTGIRIADSTGVNNP